MSENAVIISCAFCQKMRLSRTLEFVFQSIIATIGALVVGMICGAAPAIVAALVVKSSSAGSFEDRLVSLRIFRVLVDSPYFLGPIIVAFILGAFASRAWETNAGLWVWLLPTGILVWNLLTWKSYTSRTNWVDAWANYFGSDCGDSECLYELLVTAPFYTSVAYSLGCIATHIFASGKHSLKHK